MLFLFFGIHFHTKNQPYARCSLLQLLNTPLPKSTMSSSVLNIVKGMKMKEQYKTKIGVGYVVKAKVGELEKITRELRSRRISR